MATLLKGNQKPVLHIVVIGFHHKKGCQVEYSFPPLVPGGEVNSNETPPEWKNLPSLAVPDGAHNFVKDTIYFHLPAREGSHRTVYGVACYRQIDAKDLKTRTDDITRSTVQKSVCVLSNLPLYGLIQAKLELITHAYFKELDFSQVSLLEETYTNLNASLTESLLDGGSQVYLGMNVKELVMTFRHKILILFKLILLERKVLFTGSPVEKLGNAILSVLSLFPGMIEQGLVESTAYGIHRQISPTMMNTNVGENTEDFLEIRFTEDSRPEVDQYYSNEPESPIIDRGEDRLFSIKNTIVSPTSSQCNTESSLLGMKQSSANNIESKTEALNIGTSATNSLSSPTNDINLECVEDYYAKDVNDSNNAYKQTSDVPEKKPSVHRALSDANDISKHDIKLRHASAPDVSKVGVHKNSSDKRGSKGSSSSLDRNTEGSDKRSNSSFESSGSPMDVTMTKSSDTKDVSGSNKGTNQHVILSEHCDMLQGVTHYEAVQAGKSIPKNGSVINIEHSPLEIKDDYFSSTSPADGPVPTPDPSAGSLGPITAQHNISHNSVTHEILVDTDFIKDVKTAGREKKKADGRVEELDSPESISQIDQEDCFSWEDDKLSLTIDTDKADIKLDETAGLTSSFKEISVLEKLHSTEVIGSGNVGSTTQTAATQDPVSSHPSSPGVKAAAIKNRLSNAFSGLSLKGKLKKSTTSEPGSRETSSPPSPAQPELPTLPTMHQDDCGFPLAIFTKGCVCFPYLSLQYFDILNDVNVRSFVIGATNMLFRHKRHLSDVVIDVAESKIEIHERELQRQLTLTTADLRFADILVKAVTEVGEDGFFDGTEWEGNDEWLRSQFKLYLEGMCSAVLTDDSKLLEDYGVSFIQCWKTTHNYKVWSSTLHPGYKDIQPGHPCQGHLSVADIKVRLAHTMQNTEGGKKINAAVTSTGKYVVQTGKAVGGALTQAKSSLSSWFSTWKSSQDKDSKDPTSSPT